MRLAGKIFWVTMSSLAASSCFDPPEFPIIPEIEYENVRFVDVPDPNPSQFTTDSVVLEIKFMDGDGDLGLIVSPPVADLGAHVEPRPRRHGSGRVQIRATITVGKIGCSRARARAKDRRRTQHSSSEHLRTSLDLSDFY